MEQIQLCNGDNTSQLPHLGKGKAVRAGTPISRRYPTSEEAWTKGNEALAVGEGQGASA